VGTDLEDAVMLLMKITVTLFDDTRTFGTITRTPSWLSRALGSPVRVAAFEQDPCGEWIYVYDKEPIVGENLFAVEDARRWDVCRPIPKAAVVIKRRAPTDVAP